MAANPSPHLVVPFASKPQTEYVSVTPEIAAAWLKNNTVNRNLRARKVEQYAQDMRTGRWALNNDALCFSPDGRLLNGQHRLTAIVRSGCTVDLLVIRNLPAESMRVMDSGAARSASDFLGFVGEKNSTLLAATTKLCLLVSNGRIYRDTKTQGVSHSELLDFLTEHPEIRDSASVIRPASIDCPPSAAACAHWLIAQANDRASATSYLHKLYSRAGEPEGSAILAVDNRLREARRYKSTYPTRNYIYLLVKGWNAWVTGRNVRSLYMEPQRGAEFRIPEPARCVLPT